MRRTARDWPRPVRTRDLSPVVRTDPSSLDGQALIGVPPHPRLIARLAGGWAVYPLAQARRATDPPPLCRAPHAPLRVTKVAPGWEGVSSVAHGPPRARPPSLSGFDPPRGRPSSVGHSAPLITADLRSELPAACGGLSAVQRPQPHVLVSGRQFAFSLFLTHFPHESRACTARQVPAARAWVANQVKNGRSAPMRSMLPESRRHGQRQWPRWSARMSWEHALAWACRLAAGAIDRRGERQP